MHDVCGVWYTVCCAACVVTRGQLCRVTNYPLPLCEIELKLPGLYEKHLYPLSHLANLPSMILLGKIHIPHKIILKYIIPWFCVFLFKIQNY